MKRFFYYLECENTTKLFKLLNTHSEEGFITYRINEMEGLIIIDNLLLEDNDDLFKTLIKLELIEDFDSESFDNLDNGYDDFFNEDDIENN